MKDIKVKGNTIYYKGYTIDIDCIPDGFGGAFFDIDVVKKREWNFGLRSFEQAIEYIDEQEVKSETD